MPLTELGLEIGQGKIENGQPKLDCRDWRPTGVSSGFEGGPSSFQFLFSIFFL